VDNELKFYIINHCSDIQQSVKIIDGKY